jgi:hypothetical protein
MLRERIKYAATAAVTQATSIIAYSSVMRYVDSSCARINSSSRIISKGYRRRCLISQVPNAPLNKVRACSRKRAGELLNLGGAPGQRYESRRIKPPASRPCPASAGGSWRSCASSSALVWSAARRAASLNKRRTIARARRRETGLTRLTRSFVHRPRPRPCLLLCRCVCVDVCVFRLLSTIHLIPEYNLEIIGYQYKHVKVKGRFIFKLRRCHVSDGNVPI